MTSKSAAQTSAPLYFGWYIVATCFFVSFLSIPGRQGFGLFVTEMEPTFGWDRSDISWVGSVGFLMNGAMQPIMGALFDRFGPRWVFGIGLSVMGLAIMSLAFMMDLDLVLNLGFARIPLDLIWFILVFSIVINTCLSAASITNMLALVVRWFRRQRSKATALAACGTSIGGLLMIPFAAYMMGVINESGLAIGGVELAGWRTVWFMLGMIVVVLAAPLAVFFLRPSPQALGLNPDGDPDPQNAADGTPPAPPRAGLYEVDSWRKCFKTPPMWQLSGAYVVCGITTGLLSIHFIPYAEDVLPETVNFLWMTFDDKKVFAALMFGIMTGLNAAGVIITGFMGGPDAAQERAGGGLRHPGRCIHGAGIPALLRLWNVGVGGLRHAVRHVVGGQRAAHFDADGGCVRVQGPGYDQRLGVLLAPDWVVRKHPASGLRLRMV